ncbi:HAD-IA family hydrolase [Rhizobiales bacterium RZME27]|uniref:HAD-IA family hydrolase n=1 Tax=Endobacterium cereale TaxID=2663029 RepID=A0A6A8A4U4_9HYPH|nr:HAD-IA family hydrolase [Endobacterium cereale]MEB2844914.1 HAD-IA family hydrolase [Endobacterium cereale]MQY44827.1 HAD-IA family hydrolase [Endobacterium cereale]
MKILMVDVDGVLVSGRPSDGKPAFTDAERDLGLDMNRLQLHFFTPYWADIVSGREPIEPRLRAVLSEVAPHLDVEEVLRYWFENDSRLDRRLLDDLATLRAAGTKLYLATNQEHRRAGWLMQHLGFVDRFDGIFYSAALGHKKPSAAFFEIATRQAGVDPADIGFIDDAGKNIEAARQCGWAAVQWQPSMMLETALAEIRSQR